MLHRLGAAPRFDDFPDPVAHEDEVIVKLKAASLKHIDKMIASGLPAYRPQSLPVVCGVDGVGTLEDDTRVYCSRCRAPYGTMAEYTLVAQSRCVPLPDGIDDVSAAALPNPALSSWLALHWRAQLKPGETVLILGATGVAGKLAVQIAKHLGAGRVVAAGRNAGMLATLPQFGADATLALGAPDTELVNAFQREFQSQPFDIVLDYTWGQPTEMLLEALLSYNVGAPARTRLVQIGEMAGSTIALPAALLRGSGVELYGSGANIPPAAIAEALPQIFTLATQGALRIDTEPVALADVEQVWQQQATNGRRRVFIP